MHLVVEIYYYNTDNEPAYDEFDQAIIDEIERADKRELRQTNLKKLVLKKSFPTRGKMSERTFYNRLSKLWCLERNCYEKPSHPLFHKLVGRESYYVRRLHQTDLLDEFG